MSKDTLLARRERERALLEFQSAHEGLDRELSDEGPQNERRLKRKVGELKETYRRVVDAHSTVITCEKSSASDEVNRVWLREKVRKPYDTLLDRAEEVLEQLGTVDDEQLKTIIFYWMTVGRYLRVTVKESN